MPSPQSSHQPSRTISLPGPASARADEFPAGASTWPANISRRRFLELMGASLALAGLNGCNRPPEKTIVPFVSPPDADLAAGALYYATAMPWEGYARGILALSHSGRPTKLEGNPAHPDSLGATDAQTQAAVLSLYDPDRSRTPRRDGAPASWLMFEDEWLEAHRSLSASGGAGLVLLTEPTTSPTLLRGIHNLLDRFPESRWFQHTPLARYDRDGWQDEVDFERAEIILAVDADFLGQHPSSLRYTRAFAARRRPDEGHDDANRLYVIEPTPTITGTMADHRLPASPGRANVLLDALGALLEQNDLVDGLTDEERRTLIALARDLSANAPNVVCLAGSHASIETQIRCAVLNARLGASGVTHHALPAVRSDADPRYAGDLAALTIAARESAIDTLVIVGSNPAYTAAADLDFPDALRSIRRCVHLGSHVDETAALCRWHIPESHFLESWGDLRAFDGTASIVQPMIAPLYTSRSAIEFVHFLGDPSARSDYDLVRETWKNPADWDRWLNDGVIPDTASSRRTPRPAPTIESKEEKTGDLALIIRPDPSIGDGRWANNGWLQELPKPITALVWDNAALISPALAAEHSIANGDLIELVPAVDGLNPVRAPAWITPGQTADCVTVHLGYGRTHAGEVGNAHGFDAYKLRTSRDPWSADLAQIRKLPGRGTLVSTQSHFEMGGRDLVRTVAPASLGHAKEEAPKPHESLYPAVEYSGHKWGMLIDLGACTGCSACVIACQAENNIPVVGREQVALGREMHWLRLDRYYSGDLANPQMLHQPVPCMQCENAPCELVCPVAATVHTSEGLNDMIYNRCVGTRYCSNNCPYKVRRFNFLAYQEPADSPIHLQKNPAVSVRERGVMEKCTYCVQRINAGRIAARMENRRVRDGEVRTACQQVCPADAIVFGDLNDPKARVTARKQEPTHYTLLEELNTRPRTTYLARLVNSAPET